MERDLPGGGVVPECEAPPVRLSVGPTERDGVAGIEIGDSQLGEREREVRDQEVGPGLSRTSSDVEELHCEEAGVVLPPASSQENIEQI